MLIAIDAGHGHNTPGKRAPDDSMREWDFNSSVATKLCSLLKKQGMKTYRSDNTTGKTDVALITRTNNINKKKADYCISIHANANTGKWNSANGIETYIIAKGGEAEKLAKKVQKKLVEKTGLRDRGVKVGNLHMVRETDMPAILCECGFMDNKEELKLLKSDDYRNKCAEAIFEGLLEYLNIEKNANTEKEDVKEEDNKEGSDEEVRKYKNGSTREYIYADTSLTKQIGYLSPYEECDCFGIYKNRPMVRYKVDGTSNYKIGFAKWTGGVK